MSTKRSPMRRDHGVRRCPRPSSGRDDNDTSLPGQRLAAIGADVAHLAAVVNFANGGQHPATGVRGPPT